MRTRVLLTCLVAATLMVACGGDDGTGSPDVGGSPDDRDTAGLPGESPDDEAVADPDEGDDLWPDFDAETARQEAEALLGSPEDEVTESAELRIARRGEESMALTMDLRPGRVNVELDDDGTGTYVVTLVMVETPDGDDPIVVE